MELGQSLWHHLRLYRWSWWWLWWWIGWWFLESYSVAANTALLKLLSHHNSNAAVGSVVHSNGSSHFLHDVESSSSDGIHPISQQHHHVQVYHYVIHYWGKSYEGKVDCGEHLTCEWMFADSVKALRSGLDHNTSIHNDTITVSLYNIHSWWEKQRDHRPAICELPTNLTMAESEESRTRFPGFEQSFKNFDGSSTTHPTSNVQRVYLEAYLNETEFLPTRPFSELVKGAAYVASDCHRRDNANANRDGVVRALKESGLRVDGLGRCMHSIGPEGISLPNTPEARYNLTIKREVISKFMFYLAFENSIEPGYVTEKPFDGLLAGSVPVYLGDAERLKSLLPDPDAAIYEADFHGNHSALTSYLLYLQTNETAYEVHRAWRRRYSAEQHINNNPHLRRPFPCKICDWAVAAAPQHHKRHWACHHQHHGGSGPAPDSGHHKPAHAQPHHEETTSSSSTSQSLDKLEGKAVRGNSKRVYLVKSGMLHFIPDFDTFLALKLSFDEIVVLPDNELANIKEGKPIHKQAAPAAR